MISALASARLPKAPSIIAIRGELGRREHQQHIFLTVSRLSATIHTWIERSRQRQALRKLAERDDYLLKDIGVSQAEALHEAAKPFWKGETTSAATMPGKEPRTREKF
jgi:uncharacterized protein YjiS (DUF1127 family)